MADNENQGVRIVGSDSDVEGSSTFLSALRHRDDSRFYDNRTLIIFLSVGLGTPPGHFCWHGVVRKTGAEFIQRLLPLSLRKER